MAFVRACAVAEVADESALAVEIDGRQVCLARSLGVLHAISDVCSHGQVSLAEGDVEDGTVECWLHGSAFDLSTGKPTGLPANRPVPVYAVKVEGDDVLVDVESEL